MRCFEVWKANKKLGTAGIPGDAVLNVMFNWVSGSGGDAWLTVGGLDSTDPQRREHLRWIEHAKLKIGDSYRVRVVERAKTDPPKSRISGGTEAQSYRNYVEETKGHIARLKRELRGQRKALLRFKAMERAAVREARRAAKRRHLARK